MVGRPTWTDCDEAGDYVVPNVLSPRDLVFRPDNMEETVPHTDCNPDLSIYWNRIVNHGHIQSLPMGTLRHSTQYMY